MSTDELSPWHRTGAVNLPTLCHLEPTYEGSTEAFQLSSFPPLKQVAQLSPHSTAFVMTMKSGVKAAALRRRKAPPTSCQPSRHSRDLLWVETVSPSRACRRDAARKVFDGFPRLDHPRHATPPRTRSSTCYCNFLKLVMAGCYFLFDVSNPRTLNTVDIQQIISERLNLLWNEAETIEKRA
jgi:hypothetical protein